MNRRTRRLMGISLTVGVSILLAWLLVQALVIRPAIGEREDARIVEALAAADEMRRGATKHEVEDARGIDLRIFAGQPDAPPPGEGWVRLETPDGLLWKRDGGKYDIAAWNGESWAVLHEDLPIATTLALAFLAGGVPIVIQIFGLTERANRHQEQAEASLARLASGDLGERLDEEAGSREVRRVAAAVNRVADQLQELLESDRRRAAGLSHELRTPLTRIRLELELARREGGPVSRLDRMEPDIEAFDAMLAEMLELSRLQLAGEHRMTREVVDLAGLAEFVVDEERWADVEVRGSGTAMVDAKLATRLIGNLIRNSAQHAPDASRWVEVADNTVSVGDDGPGIPVARHAQIFDAFQRGEASAGHGLGLAIVAQIATLHDATLTLSEPPGLTVTLVFPEHDRS